MARRKMQGGTQDLQDLHDQYIATRTSGCQSEEEFKRGIPLRGDAIVHGNEKDSDDYPTY